MTSTLRPFLLAGLVCLGALPSAPAQTTGTTTPPDAKMPPPMLDNDEMLQLQKVRNQVLGAHPELKAEEEKLKALHDANQSQNPPPTADQRNADFAEWKSYQKKMRAEMLKIDPTLQPLFSKLDSARQHGAPAPFAPAK